MNNDVINSKIESIRHCLKRIRHKAPGSAQQLKDDYDLQDIISVNLERATQISVDLAAHIIADSERKVPDTMAETIRKLPEMGIIDDALAERLSRAVGFRNISVHEYQAIDWDIVYDIIRHHLDDFDEFIRQILRWQSERGA